MAEILALEFVAVGELMLDIGYSVRMVTNYFENNNVLELSLNF